MPRVGQPAPQVIMSELDGQVFDLAQARGKVVILSLVGDLVRALPRPRCRSWIRPMRRTAPRASRSLA